MIEKCPLYLGNVELLRTPAPRLPSVVKADILSLIKLYFCIINKNAIDEVVRIYETSLASQQCRLSA